MGFCAKAGVIVTKTNRIQLTSINKRLLTFLTFLLLAVADLLTRETIDNLTWN